jgi:hypothetical protein
VPNFESALGRTLSNYGNLRTRLLYLDVSRHDSAVRRQLLFFAILQSMIRLK